MVIVLERTFKNMNIEGDADHDLMQAICDRKIEIPPQVASEAKTVIAIQDLR